MLIKPGAEKVVADQSCEDAQLQTKKDLVYGVGTVIDTLQAKQDDA